MSKRGFCFTINNWSDEDIADCLLTDCDYMITAFEVGEDGTPHIQGFAYFKSKVAFNTVKAALPRAHIEEMKGTLAQAIEYCMKDNDFFERGNRPRQGKRSDLDIIRYDILNGTDEIVIANKYFSQWCQYRRAFREYKHLCQSKFDTLMVIFDPFIPESAQAASKYFTPNSVLYDPTTLSLWLEYYTGKYQTILVPKSTGVLNIVECDNFDKKNIKYIIV